MIQDTLARAAAEAGFTVAMVVSDEGLPLVSVGESLGPEQLSGFTALFDDVLVRAERDLGFRRLDEVSLLDPRRGRLVIRPLIVGDTHFFLVVQLPTNRTWRRATNALCRKLQPWLAGLLVSA